jgi:hypothetical protein
MKKLVSCLMAMLFAISIYSVATVNAFQQGVEPGPSGQSHLNLGLVNSCDYSTFQGAVNDIGTANALLMMTCSLPLNQNLTVPSNVQLDFAGGQVTYDASATGTITLTINGAISANPVKIFSGTNLSVVINLATNPLTYAAWGTFTTTGNPAASGGIPQFGTTTLVNGSAIVTFATGSTFSSSVSYAGFATTQGTGGTASVTQQSGSQMTVNGSGTDKVNWSAIGR